MARLDRGICGEPLMSKISLPNTGRTFFAKQVPGDVMLQPSLSRRRHRAARMRAAGSALT